MSGYGTSPGAEDPGLFRRLRRPEPMPAEPMMTASAYQLADTLQRAVDDRLEEGLRTIEEQATGLMREVATEIWRSTSRDMRPEQERIVTLLSRDQAIRSLIASSDERFQALAMRTARLEDNLHDLSETGRQTRESMEATARQVRLLAESPTLNSVEAVQSQLAMVERHIAETFSHIDERERTLQDTILTQVKQHGDLIARETTRIVESMESYVQGGAEAVGQIAQRMEEHATLFLNADHDITARVEGIVRDQTTELTEQLDMVNEKVGLHGRNQEQLRAELARVIEHRIMGMAQLIRSDSEALHRLIEERDAEVREATAREIDEKMTALATIQDARIGELERTIQDQVMLLSSATSASIERTMERMVETMGSVDGLDAALAESQGAAQERLLAQMEEAQERLLAQVREAQESVVARVQDGQAALFERLLLERAEQEERLAGHVDDRMTAIARLIRSDNKVLAERFEEVGAAGGVGGAGSDPEVLRQVLRSVKELQAGVASDLLGTVDRRFQAVSDQLHNETQSQAEAMVKIAELLSDRIDRLSAKVDEGVGGDLQIVIDRMSDAIQAMSTVRRQAS
jgi:hypothetical protein